ncbi:Metallo-dependent hydrolase [Amylocystis lapponica]|nr:Metallo-dependent hydrolase [Amylocystis lapponica]
MTEDYLKRREQLILEDRAQRVDTARLASLPPIEQQAEAIVRAIRAQEAVSVWDAGKYTTSDYSPDDTSPNIFPGMSFLTGSVICASPVLTDICHQARETIMQTKLFNILSKMPKGALLHAHLDATVNARVLLRLALAQPAMHVRTPVNLTANNIKTTLPQFIALPRTQFSALSSLTDASYSPGVWVPVSKARESFDESLGGPGAFDDWVVSALMINPSEAYETHNTTAKIWAKFTSTFMVSHALIHFLPTWTEYVREFILSSIEDGICYTEARINFWYKTMVGADGQNTVPHREWVLIYERVINEIKADMKRQGRENEFVGSRIIYVTLRFISCEELEWYLEDCLALKQEFPHLIAGFDLVGHEDSLKPLLDYIGPLTKFVARQKELGIHIPFIFHAGETLGDGSAPDMNLYDAILLGTTRIGHGFSLVKHPKLIALCKEHAIAVEMCPISNEILRLTSSMPMHPLPVLVNHGVHVALCSDDPAVFGNMGLSYDFFQVLVASEVTGLVTAGEFARDSIRHSTLEDAEKAHALELYEKQWMKFVEWVVQEYSAGE